MTGGGGIGRPAAGRQIKTRRPASLGHAGIKMTVSIFNLNQNIK
jgi:hypothetical protein